MQASVGRIIFKIVFWLVVIAGIGAVIQRLPS